MPAALGLTTYRWNNNLKSSALLVAFPALLMLLVGVILYGCAMVSRSSDGLVDPALFDYLGLDPSGGARRPLDFAAAGLARLWLPVLAIALVWVAIGYLFNEHMIRAATGAQPVARDQAPELYNLLETLCISRGIATPKLNVIDSDGMNAFASGIDARSYAITVTRGLLERLTRDELEAVLGHELTHIINRDVRLLIVTVVFVGMISFLAQMLWRNLRYGSSGRRERNPMIAVAAAALAVGYLLALVLRLALSRTREYLADAGSVALTKNPEALISALRKIAGNPALPDVPPEVRQMFIENPPGGLAALGLFATHPPIEARIRVLEQLGGLPPHGAPPPHHASVIPEAGRRE
jgi:heat shock protein HtpX